MYVKMTGDPDAIYQAIGPIMFGRIAIALNGQDEPDYKKLPFSIGQLHVGVINFDDRTNYEESQGIIALSYAYWTNQGEDALISVVTTRAIFILGDDGKTIDRVR